MNAKIPFDMNRHIPFKTKVGYSLGGTGDAIAYDFIGSFLMFFLTGLVRCVIWRLTDLRKRHMSIIMT